MISRDSKCVYVGNSVSEATVVANWLEHQGIDTQVMDSLTHGGLEGLAAWTGASSRGIELWVSDPEDADHARELIEQHGEFQAQAEVANERKEPVLAFCEECGQSATFRSELLGSIQDCPHCGRYMDVVEDVDSPANRTLLSDQLPGEASSPSMISALRSLQKPIIILVLGGMGFYIFMAIASGIAAALGL